MQNITVKPAQLAWLDWEFGVFFHFGIRTFYEGHRDWDMQPMHLDGFNPTRLDCRQWIETIARAGARYAVLVCKHHDGFANWPSAYTQYSVAHTPWKNGQGDVVREYVDACRAYGVRVGLYYSPAEFGSKAREARDYDDYFIHQIGELLRNYGKIDYLWFDGNGSGDHSYDRVRIVSEIRRLQPDILLFNMWDPDTRWCGNEAGYTHAPNLYVANAHTPTVHTDAMIEPDRQRFLPAECDCRMRRHNWFYSDLDEDTVKSIDELMGIYDYSVGRGGNMLINIGPNREGLLPQKDAARLVEFGDALCRRFANPLISAMTAMDNICMLELEAPQLIRQAVLREKVSEKEMVQGFRIECYPYDFGEPVAVHFGKTIGHKYICNFSPFYTRKVRIVAEAGDMNLIDVRLFSV